MDSNLQTDAVLYDSKDSCSTLTLNRRQVGNALNSAMVEALDMAFDRAIQGDARLIVFRGVGRHMCTGFDLSDINNCTDGDLLLRFVRIEQFLQKIYRSPVVTAAIGSGRVYGAGADLFACCDRRIGLSETNFAFPGSGFGLILGTRRLASRIGSDNCRQALLEGGAIPVADAARMGLVTDRCAEQDLPDLLARISCAASRLPSCTVAAIHAVTASPDDASDLAALVTSASHPGLKNRIQAYREKVLADRARQ